MSSLAEPIHPGEFIVTEANGERSRENITIVSGAGKLVAGQVLGKILSGTATGAAVGTPQDTIGAVVVSQGVLPGVYDVIILNTATLAKFAVMDPNGVLVGIGTVGTQFSAGGLQFTITDVGTHAVVGDLYTITVAAGSGKYGPIAAAGADGTQHAAGILLAAVDATSADQPAVAIVRSAEVNASLLGWNGLNNNQQTAAIAELKALGIIVRTAV